SVVGGRALPIGIGVFAVIRLKAWLKSAMSFASVRWRLLAVLLAVSFVAYGFLLYGQYRDQYGTILSFAESSNRLFTEVMAPRIESAVRNLDQREVNRTLLDTIRATEVAGGHREGEASAGGAAGDLPAALIALGVIRADGVVMKTYHSPLWLDFPEQALT